MEIHFLPSSVPSSSKVLERGILSVVHEATMYLRGWLGVESAMVLFWLIWRFLKIPCRYEIMPRKLTTETTGANGKECRCFKLALAGPLEGQLTSVLSFPCPIPQANNKHRAPSTLTPTGH
jgi:hypothetical protein